MKRNYLRTLALVLAAAVLPVSSAFAEDATVTASQVNVRSGPGMNYDVFTSLPRGTVVTVTNRSDDNWYAVAWEEKSGYIASRYLDLSESAESNAVVTTSYPSEKSGTVNTMYVCLRSGPGKDHAIMDILTAGKALTATGSSGDWIAVSVGGKVGYIHSDYVTLDDSAENSVADITIEDSSRAEATITPESASASSESSSLSVVPIPAPTMLIVETPAPDVPADSIESAAETVPVPAAETSAPAVSAVRTGIIQGDGVRLRSGPGTTFLILDSYDNGQEVILVGTSGEWTEVRVNGLSGYILSSFIRENEPPASTIEPQVGTPSSEEVLSGSLIDPANGQSITLVPKAPSPSAPEPGYITGNSVRLRTGPSMNAAVLTEFSYGTAVTITGTSGDWTAVSDGPMKGYVYSEYVARGTFAPEEIIAESNASVQGKDIATFALNYVGYPYAWGGQSPATGFDCSGFVCYVYSQFGYTLSRVANDQAADGVHVDPADIQPGDVLCFYSGNNYVGHTGIYIGDDTFVHAANSATGVVAATISGYYAVRGYEIRRIIT